MRGKKELKAKLEQLKALRTTIMALSHNKSLVKELKAEFITMTKNLQNMVVLSLNDKEEKDAEFDRIRTMTIDTYTGAFIIFCDLNKQIGGF